MKKSDIDHCWLPLFPANRFANKWSIYRNKGLFMKINNQISWVKIVKDKFWSDYESSMISLDIARDPLDLCEPVLCTC